MKRLALLTFVLFALMSLTVGAVGVVAQDIRYDFDKDQDFSKYKTYEWVPIKGADQPDDLTAKQITGAIDAVLAKKGLTETDSDTADLYIGYQTAIGTEKQYTSYTTGWGAMVRAGVADGMDITAECRQPQHTDQPQPFTSASSTSACTTAHRRNWYGVALQQKL